MNPDAHLWAIGYDGVEKARQVRKKLIELGWGEGEAGKYLLLLDTAVVERHTDGSFTLDHQPFPALRNIMASTTVGFLTGLVLGTPLIGTTVGAALGLASTAAAADAVIDQDFIQEVEALIKPGTSALFVLDSGGHMDVILHTIRGLGGVVLKTNVDLEHAKLIQSALAASSADPITRSAIVPK